jgi:hypothetical protein
MFNFVALPALAFVYLVTKTIYRLYFHPLSHIPGPRLAACTSLYNAYYDILGTGLVKELPDYHARYGPVVRIQPNEVHVSTLSGYSEYAINFPLFATSDFIIASIYIYKGSTA